MRRHAISPYVCTVLTELAPPTYHKHSSTPPTPTHTQHSHSHSHSHSPSRLPSTVCVCIHVCNTPHDRPDPRRQKEVRPPLYVKRLYVRTHTYSKPQCGPLPHSPNWNPILTELTPPVRTSPQMQKPPNRTRPPTLRLSAKSDGELTTFVCIYVYVHIYICVCGCM